MPRSEYDIEVVLPEHEHSKKSFICYNCKAHMMPCTGSEIYFVDEKKIRVSNIKMYRCPECKEVVYSATEAGRIEEAVYGTRF